MKKNGLLVGGLVAAILVAAAVWFFVGGGVGSDPSKPTASVPAGSDPQAKATEEGDLPPGEALKRAGH